MGKTNNYKCKEKYTHMQSTQRWFLLPMAMALEEGKVVA